MSHNGVPRPSIVFHGPPLPSLTLNGNSWSSMVFQDPQ
jgi:hypothetical protein